jgi:phenylacetate-coenzyme A ligase PaaK-like adenylate-forming protein
LKATLQHAYDNSPVYKRKFDAAGVHPSDCKSLADLAKFPFTTKADLRDSYPYGMFAVPRSGCSRIHASSGTTGKPTVVADPDGALAEHYRAIARRVAVKIAESQKDMSAKFPTIVVSKDT